MESEIRLEIVGLIQNQSVPSTYGLVMQEADGNRRFSIIIGEPEAQSIVLKKKKKVLPRPLTHDLMKNILLSLKAELKKVVICDLVNDLFYSNLHIEGSDGAIRLVDARTSDAVALAVWTGCPIYIKEDILHIVGTYVEPGEEEDDEVDATYSLDDLEGAGEESLRLLASEALNVLLEQAVEEERYELAAKLKKVLDIKNNK